MKSPVRLLCVLAACCSAALVAFALFSEPRESLRLSGPSPRCLSRQAHVAAAPHAAAPPHSRLAGRRVSRDLERSFARISGESPWRSSRVAGGLAVRAVGDAEEDDGRDDDVLPTDLRQATSQAAEALQAAYDKGERKMRIGLLIEEMSRGAKQNVDLDEARVLCRVADEYAEKSGFNNIKFLFQNVGTSMQHKKWLAEMGSKAEVSSLDRPQQLTGNEELIVLIKPDLFGLKSATSMCDQADNMPFENRPAIVMLNENFGDSEDKGEGFLNVPQLETTQARRLKARFDVTYFLEQVLSRQSGIIVLFKKYPGPWQLFVADEGQYKLLSASYREPGDEEIFDFVSEFNRNKQVSQLWQSFRWRRQVEGLLDNFGLPKPFDPANDKKKNNRIRG
mmetsp:Transcript_3414/g.6536  ORF Transcript_3414/g.6536 Transcript_3414/m.6536 type:complete len:393 (+) Transcript_3414:18-1196(+)